MSHPTPERLTSLLTASLRSLSQQAEDLFQRWVGSDEATLALQRAALHAGVDLCQVCDTLLREFDPEGPAPGEAAPAWCADEPLADARAADYVAPTPTDDPDDSGETPLDGQLRLFVREALGAHYLTGRLLSDWRAGAEVDTALVEAVHAAAAVLRPQARRLLDEFDRGARDTDRLEAQALQAEAEREARQRAVLQSLSYIGARDIPKAWTLIGWRCEDDIPVAIPRDRGQLILATGVPGSGKSQCGLTQIEGVLRPQPGTASASMPATAVVAFHTDLSGVTLPELLWSVLPNRRDADARLLDARLGALPAPLLSVRLAVPEWLLPEYRQRVAAELGAPRGLTLLPLRCHLGQLGAPGLQALVGAFGDDEDAQYLQALMQEAEALGDALTVAGWRGLVEGRRDLNAALRERALERIRPLARLEAPPGSAGLWDLVEPGTLTIVALGGRWLGHRDALPLVTALMNAASQPGGPHGPFHRMFHLDEVSRLRGDARLWNHLVMTARQQRHWATTLWLLGQDLKELPDELIALASICLVFRQGSPRVYGHLRARLAGLQRRSFGSVSRLLPGQALVVGADAAAECSRVRIWMRPPACLHGGHTVGVV